MSKYWVYQSVEENDDRQVEIRHNDDDTWDVELYDCGPNEIGAEGELKDWILDAPVVDQDEALVLAEAHFDAVLDEAPIKRGRAAVKRGFRNWLLDMCANWIRLAQYALAGAVMVGLCYVITVLLLLLFT